MDLILGIGLERIKPGHLEQSGRHERMHLTLKREATKPAPPNFLQQQARFEAFVSGSDAPVLSWIVLYNQVPFGASPSADGLTLVTQTQDETSVADAVTKFYVAPGQTPRVYVSRTDLNTLGSAIALLTGYLVNYP
jgi:hypothetical protein